MTTGALLSIAKYDDEMRDKDGRCMEYKDDEWIGEWVYEKGKKKRVIREYRNGVVTLYDDKENKTYEGKMSREEVNDGFYGHEPVDELGDHCFTIPSDNHGEKKRFDGCLRIVNCSKLRSIHFLSSSFEEYYILKLENLPSLESFEMNGWMWLSSSTLVFSGK